MSEMSQTVDQLLVIGRGRIIVAGPVQQVMGIMGWSSIGMAASYQHVSVIRSADRSPKIGDGLIRAPDEPC